MAREIALKITGYQSVEQVLRFANSWLVDLAVVSHIGPGCVLLMPEDPDEIDLGDPAQFAWFRTSVLESLPDAGLSCIVVAADPVDPAAEDVRRR